MSDSVDFRKLTWAQLQGYFRHHLQLLGYKDEDMSIGGNGILTLCPFHDDSKPSLSICLHQRDGKGGVWQCFGCGISGWITCFEVAVAGLKGESINKRTAWVRAQKVLREGKVSGK